MVLTNAICNNIIQIRITDHKCFLITFRALCHQAHPGKAPRKLIYIYIYTHHNQCTSIGTYENVIYSRQHLQRLQKQMYIKEFRYMYSDCHVYTSDNKM